MRHQSVVEPLPFLPRGFSPQRSLSLAVALGLHLVLAAVMLVPIAAPVPEEDAPRVTPVFFDIEKPKPPVIPPPPPVPVRVVRTPTPQLRDPARLPLPTPEPALSITTDTPSPLDTAVPDAGAGAEPGPVQEGPMLETLQLVEGSAPRYPREALQRRLEGEVQLLILVGVDGRPEEVSIARSSGHAALDRAARDHVKRRWVFEPAQRNGIAVSAWARVPVRFTLP